MEITVNQQAYLVNNKCTIQYLLTVVIKQSAKGLAVAINQTIIPKTEWESRLLNPGDQIVIIKATQGG